MQLIKMKTIDIHDSRMEYFLGSALALNPSQESMLNVTVKFKFF